MNRCTSHRDIRPLIFDKKSILALLVTMMLGGLFQIISQTSRFTLWGIWILIWLIICTYNLTTLRRLWRPALPFVVWFAVYGIWGAIASPVPVFADVGRDFFRLITIMMAVAVLAADRLSLRHLGYLTTWVLILNLLVSIALLERLPLAQFLVQSDFASASTQPLLDRYSGLWGNANLAGMDTLILLVLSAYGRGWLIWLGRVAGVAIIYLTASRTSTYLLLLIGLVFLYTSLRGNRRARWIIFGSFVALSVTWLSGAFDEFRTTTPEKSTYLRIFDPLEAKTELAGGLTRLGIFEMWLPVIERDPWCGYGYGAMGGGAIIGGDSSVNKVFRTDIPFIGVHNMYLGTWIDGGFFGGISFLVLIGIGLLTALRSRLAANDKTVVLALWLVAIVFGASAHNLQGSLDGQALYLLCFILPGSIALKSAFVSQEPRRQLGRLIPRRVNHTISPNSCKMIDLLNDRP